MWNFVLVGGRGVEYEGTGPNEVIRLWRMQSFHHSTAPSSAFCFVLPAWKISVASYGHHHHHHFWQVPLRVRSAERRHQSPEWMVLSQVNCVVHIKVAGFWILLNGFHPCNMRTSQWSRPVSCGGSC